MREYKYKKINAFTNQYSLGNPAACIYLNQNDELSTEVMQEIAKQHQGFVSEVVYCRVLKDNNLHITFYSSECEVDFCGHGTIACMYSLIKESEDLIKKAEISVLTNKKGQITIYNRILDEDTIYITAPEPIYYENNSSIKEISKYLELSMERIADAYPIELIDAGLKTLIVPIKTFSDEVNIYPDRTMLEEFCLKQGIDIILVYSWDVGGEGYYAHTRVFAPKYGYLEDPATGSGNSAFGYYLLKNDLWDGKPITIEQGGARMAYNTVKLYADIPSNTSGSILGRRVLFGGAATDCIVGRYYI